MLVSTALQSAHDIFHQFLERREKSGIVTDTRRLREVFSFAEEEYGESMHWTGESVLHHCLGVLQVFSAFNPDDDAVIACLLHHLLDRHHWNLDALEERYGADVRTMVSGEFLLSHVTLKNRRMSLEHMRLMFLKVSGDVRLALLLLSQQSHLLNRLSFLAPEDRKRICRDTLQIYAPVAARLGIYSLKHEMESKAFPVVYPTDAMRIAEQLEQVHEKHRDFLKHVAENIMRDLQDAGLNATVQIREKQPYSIFHKMQVKSLSHVEDLYDLFAFRVLVSSEVECYQGLGVLHKIGHPVVGRFKDYIAFPKPNGYKSLHTTLARLPGVPEGLCIEAQIRTHHMQREAEYGIAAHWGYKEAGTAEQALSKVQLQQALMSPSESTTSLRGIADEIFVLTPQGDVIQLPEGATPLDFAFHVHTTLGLSFRAAKVNGSIVPLTYVLENGDIIEILKHRDPHPSPHWITLLKTASARSRLKRYLAAHERPTYLAIGRDEMNEELARHHLPPLDTDLKVLRKFDGKTQTVAEREDLLIQIGQGSHNPASMFLHLDAFKEQLVKKMQPTVPVKIVSGRNVVAQVEGDIRMPVRYAKCCKPDETRVAEIAGVVSRMGDVRVHAKKCKMLKTAHVGRRIAVKWVAKK